MTEERKVKVEKFRELVKQVAKMNDEDRKSLASKTLITNTTGHTLSLINNILIAYQGGINYTIVGGFKQWIEQKRVVRKGQHGVNIWVPIGIKKDKDTDEIVNSDNLHFMMGTVFDISQTEPLEATQ